MIRITAADPPAAFKTGAHAGGVQQKGQDVLDLGRKLGDASDQILPNIVVKGKTDAAWSDQSLAETITAQKKGHVEKIAAHATAIVGRWKEGDVAAQGAQITHVIGDAFKLQGNRANRRGPGIDV